MPNKEKKLQPVREREGIEKEPVRAKRAEREGREGGEEEWLTIEIRHFWRHMCVFSLVMLETVGILQTIVPPLAPIRTPIRQPPNFLSD